MADQTPHEPIAGDSLDRLGPTAIISYLCILIFAASTAAVFCVVFFDLTITTPQAGVLGTVLGASATGYGTVQQFWIGGNIGAKAATTALKQIATGTGTGQTITAPNAQTQTITTGGASAPPDEFAIPAVPGETT